MANLRIPIYSMRSYETGTYDLSKDGNFQVHLARMNPDDWIAVPKNSKGLQEFTRKGLIDPFRVIKFNYGINAYETRKNFWKMNPDIRIPNDVDLIVTNLTGCPITEIPIIYYLETTSHPLVPKLYVDEFFKRDVDSVNSSLRTKVFNLWQKKWLIANGADGDRIDLDQRVVSPKLLKSLIEFPFDGYQLQKDDIFFPFRISDPCYKYEHVKKMAALMNRRLVVTDPNDSFDKRDQSSSVVLMKPTKNQYYSILMNRPMIMYFEDPEFCFHPGLGELIYFGCDIISPYKLPSRSDIVIE